jgi:hypothetical protein
MSCVSAALFFIKIASPKDGIFSVTFLPLFILLPFDFAKILLTFSKKCMLF